MADSMQWRTGGVKVVRGQSLIGTTRATAFDFAGSGGRETWIGMVTLPSGANTGAHHHGRHEVAVYVVRGRSRIRWGERLEFATDVGAGDFVYFAPFVPHQEQNLDPSEPLGFLVVRSDNAGVKVDLDLAPVEAPEALY